MAIIQAAEIAQTTNALIHQNMAAPPERNFILL